jgi:hypothetical protein
VSGRSSLDCGYQVPSKLFAASLTHMSFGWQTGELFVGRAVTSILTTNHRQDWPLVNRVAVLL